MFVRDKRLPRATSTIVLGLLSALLALVVVACGGGEETTVVETVIVEVPGDTVVETVVETVVVPGAAVVETVIVEVPAAPAELTGEVIVGEVRILPPIGLPSKQGTGTDFHYVDWGVYENLMRAAPHLASETPNPESATHGIATSWVADSAAETVTFKIRTGVMFHDGWGELTAHDVAFSFNEGNKEGTTFSRSQKDRVDFWEATDDTTVVMHYKEGQFDPKFVTSLWGSAGGSTPMISKKLVEELGDGAISELVGTGPYEVETWRSDDEVVLQAFSDYWRADGQPLTQTVKVVAIPEEAVRIAALKTGEIDITSISSKFLTGTLGAIPGSTAYAVGAAQNQILYFGGNYWTKTWREENEEVFPRPGLKADAEHPWIGDPTKPETLETSRKFRRALSIAIDRDLINETILAGLGAPSNVYLATLGDGTKYFKEDWRIPYDPEGAKELLAEIGISSDTVINMWIPPDNVAVDPEVGQGIAQMWRDIGLNVQIESTAYAARRPSLVSRSMDILWMHHWGVNGEEDGAFLCCHKPSGGFSKGMEVPDGNYGMPDILGMYYANRTEEDFITRVQNNIAIHDFMNAESWVAPVVKAQANYVTGPGVQEWRPSSFAWKDFISPETIVMK